MPCHDVNLWTYDFLFRCINHFDMFFFLPKDLEAILGQEQHLWCVFEMRWPKHFSKQFSNLTGFPSLVLGRRFFVILFVRFASRKLLKWKLRTTSYTQHRFAPFFLPFWFLWKWNRWKAALPLPACCPPLVLLGVASWWWLPVDLREKILMMVFCLTYMDVSINMGVYPQNGW